jgi:hypothetical protein
MALSLLENYVPRNVKHAHHAANHYRKILATLPSRMAFLGGKKGEKENTRKFPESLRIRAIPELGHRGKPGCPRCRHAA